ncbi:hypothetical protein DEF28_26905, partial [Marinitenerispora sediminis]
GGERVVALDGHRRVAGPGQVQVAVHDTVPGRGATSGLVVRSLTEGDVLYRREPGTPLIPASNAKLLTAAAALDVLGTDHRFATTVHAGAAPRDGVVHGDLYLAGTGDPTMTVERYDALAA